MRGRVQPRGAAFSRISPQYRVLSNHPRRSIKDALLLPQVLSLCALASLRLVRARLLGIKRVADAQIEERGMEGNETAQGSHLRIRKVSFLTSREPNRHLDLVWRGASLGGHG